MMMGADERRTVCPSESARQVIWLRGRDLNPRPSGYEPDELPGCSTPRLEVRIMPHRVANANAKTRSTILLSRKSRGQRHKAVGSSASISFGTRSHRAAL